MKQNTHIRPVKHRTIHALVLALAVACCPWPAAAATYADIQLWAGSGANQAGLVIDWNDGKSAESLLWGYRWDGAATGLEMLQAVVSADPRLFAHFGDFGWGTATLGIGYDLNGSGGFGVAPPLGFDSGGLAIDTSPDDSRVASDAADHWVEGWDYGFWAYYVKASPGDVWTSALFGAADRALADGLWDGYSFAPGFDGPAPGEPVAAPVPEPIAWALFITGAALLACTRKNRP